MTNNDRAMKIALALIIVGCLASMRGVGIMLFEGVSAVVRRVSALRK